MSLIGRVDKNVFVITAIALAVNGIMSSQTFAAEEKKEEADSLGSVVVTSQKREEKIQEVPIPITAISGADIKNKNIVLNTDIEKLAPNLSAQGGGRVGKPRWFLRGIGTNDPNQTIEAPIGIYIDEVVVGLQRLQSFPLFDLERVEVLRGPQGTLWGKNNTGGAIHYISKKPSFDPDGYAKFTIGNFGSKIIETAVGGALQGEALAGRASVYSEQYNGWATNILNGDSGPQLKDFNARFQLLANITSDLEAHLIVGLRNADIRNDPAYAPGGTNLPPPNSAVTLPNPGGRIDTGLTPGQISAGLGYLPPFGAFPDVYSPFFAGDGYNKDDRKHITFKLNWQLGDYTLTSITGWSNGDGDTYSSVGVPLNTALPRVSTKNRNQFRQISQELRLSSPSQKNLSWIAGAYYYNLKASQFNRSARFANGASNTIALNRDNYTESSWDQDSESQAIFGNLKYKWNDKTSITFGARYTRESKTMTQTALSVTDTAGNTGIVNFVSENGWFLPGGITGTGNFSPLRLSDKGSWNKFTWDLTPEYRFNKDLLGYVRIATGFRSGGFNQAISQPAGGTPFILKLVPETLTDYEVGLKSTWLNGKLNFNVAAFYYDLKNIQLNIQQRVLQQDGTFQTSSSGQSDGVIKGLEFEVDSKPISNWNIGGGLGFIHSEYKNFIYRVGNSAPQNASGNEFYRTPKVQFRLFTDYSLPVGNSGNRWVFGTDWSYRSKILHNATVQNDPLQTTPAYWIGNARISYVGPKDKWQITAFVNNLTDKNEAFLRQIVNTNGVAPVSVGDPKTYGLQATFKF
jgi:iron complex outermembrane receptor protein